MRAFTPNRLTFRSTKFARAIYTSGGVRATPHQLCSYQVPACKSRVQLRVSASSLDHTRHGFVSSLQVLVSSSTDWQLRATSADDSTESVYCLNVSLYVKPERREEFLETIRANAQGTRTKEPLALEYSWGESATESNTFHFHEKYKGRAGFEAHTQASHFADWEKFAGSDPFSKEPKVEFYELN
ncbi:hypothetical protein CYMTET_13378 [Cymbomonas tetramitiformis]|uniref:ABM domain-containing protein n=1 Tax=Cymbomonas tetramitiformis TaxID=36881 RepID=A0AAE0LB90_9CHLO|nr:hypothetical protein CYMTET_13378 [Cymbomonas tetramitiformis]